MKKEKDSWLGVLLSYTDGSGRRMLLSIILSIISVISGLIPYYCIYRAIDLYIRNINNVPIQDIVRWCLYALLFHVIKIVCFSASTWISHIAAYHILEGLRLRLRWAMWKDTALVRSRALWWKRSRTWNRLLRI